MDAEIVTVGTRDTAALREGIFDTYQRVFSLPPFNESAAQVLQFRRAFDQHTRQEGFRCCVARDPDTLAVLGFGYGYTGRKGQWWHDLVSEGLGPGGTERWLSNAFDVVDLGVIPPARGRHVGERLHDELLRGLPHSRAVLSTFEEETPAFSLYRKKGWLILRDGFLFPGVSRPFVILGRELPL